jgi:hypothetical protein
MMESFMPSQVNAQPYHANHYSEEFTLFFKSFLEAKKWRVKAPWELLFGWNYFVTECERGYQWTIYEYNNEISVRESMEHILDALRSQSFAEIAEFREAVATIDERFKSLALPDYETCHQEYWWERIILKHAGTDYAEAIFADYGVQIEVVPA